jgi:N-acetyl-anhydromuramoyl-L-alanine amidase
MRQPRNTAQKAESTVESAVESWAQGWYGPARAVPSPNFGPRPPGVSIDLIVVHSISLPPGQFGSGCVEQLFTNTLDWSAHPYFETIRGIAVSAHFFIQRDGALLQFVSCDDRAWHAGRSHYRGRDNCNDDSVGIELEGVEGDSFSADQYKTLFSLCQALRQQYPIAHIAGHEDIAPGRKTDPGTGFDWVLMQIKLSWPALVFPDRCQAVPGD